MGRKGKYTKETKLKAIQEYINGSKSLSEISNELECHLETVREWVTMYRGCGETIFDDKKNNQSYSKEFKEQIVKEYLEGKGSLSDLRIKYNIFTFKEIQHEDYQKNIDGGNTIAIGSLPIGRKGASFAQQLFQC